jgi:integrase
MRLSLQILSFSTFTHDCVHHLLKLVAQVGAPKACVHDLQHTFAVLSLLNGDYIKTLQENLRHATADFTLDVYGHVSDKMRVNISVRMESFL